MARTDTIADDEQIVIHRHQHLPRPVSASKATSMSLFGIEPKRWPKFLRLLGVGYVETPGGPVALVADVETALRDRGQAIEPASATPAPDPEAAALARAGLRLVDVPRRAGGHK